MKNLITISGILFIALQCSLYAQTQIGQNITGSDPGDYNCPNALNSDGTILITGAPQNGGTRDGYARVFEFDGNDWVQMGSDLLYENAADEFGWQVAINSIGDIVAVYASSNDGNGTDAGHTRVYQFDGNDWIQLGDDIDGEAAGDAAGRGAIDLSSDGTILAMSGPYNDGGGVDAGHVRVFEYDGNDWVQQGNAMEGEAYSLTGYNVSLNNDGSRVTVGSMDADTANGFQSGKVGVFEFDGNDWVQLGNDILGEEDFDRFGYDAVLNGDGNIVAIGAAWSNGDGGNDTGSASVFQFDGNDWVQMGQDVDGDQDGASGWEVSINGDGTIISYGAYSYDGADENTGLVRVYKYNGIDWIQRGVDIEGSLTGYYEGWTTSLNEDGTILATGGFGASSSRGIVRVWDLSEIITIYALDGTTSVSIPSVNCENTEIEPTITLTNVGTEDITSASIDWNLDGGSNTTINFNGTLATNESETFNIGPLTVSVGVHDVNVSLTSINAGADDNPNNDDSSSSIDIAELNSYNSSQVHLELQTDQYPEETSWEFRNSDGTVLYSFGPYQAGSDAFTTFNYSFDVDDNSCYFFEIFDSWGDGICCVNGGVGSYTLTTDDNTLIATGGEFTFNEITNLGIDDNLGTNDFLAQNIVIYPNPATNIINFEGSSTELQVNIYDMLGREVVSQTVMNQMDVSFLKSGIYLVRLTDGEKSTTHKLIKK